MKVSSMTPQDWQMVEERLKGLYAPVRLRCDGFEVTLALERYDPFKNGIMVYVGGVILGRWILHDCEERRRFMRPRKVFLFSQKQRTSLKKTSKRKRREYHLPDPDASFIQYDPYWTSFRSLKSHLIKNNSTIELVGE